LKRCNRFIKRIELLELFRMLLSCKNRIPCWSGARKNDRRLQTESSHGRYEP
jgi:hypothetical protein